MTLSAALFNQPVHIIAQKRKAVPLTGAVRIAKKQNKTMPLNTAAQKAGARYEKQIEKYLQTIVLKYGCKLYSHTWFELGRQTFQTDFFLIFPSGAAILFEVKQTWVDTSNQLTFYKYLLTEVGFEPVTCCTICKNLTPETPQESIVHFFEDIKENAVWQMRT